MAVLRAASRRVAGLLLVDTRAVADNDEQSVNRLTVADRAEREGAARWLAESTLPNLLGSTTHERWPEVVASVRDLVYAQPADGVAWAQPAMAGRPEGVETLRS